MDGWVRVLHPFNNISVISRQWEGEHERLCAMKRRLGSGRISPPAGFEPATPWSKVGSANRSATRTLHGQIWFFKKHFKCYAQHHPDSIPSGMTISPGSYKWNKFGKKFLVISLKYISFVAMEKSYFHGIKTLTTWILCYISSQRL